MPVGNLIRNGCFAIHRKYAQAKIPFKPLDLRCKDRLGSRLQDILRTQIREFPHQWSYMQLADNFDQTW